MKKVIFFVAMLFISFNMSAQIVAMIMKNNTTNCNVAVKLMGTSSVYACNQLIVSTVNLNPGGGSVSWNTFCNPPFVAIGWAVGANPFTSGSCPGPFTVDPAFTWTDAVFTYSCPLPCTSVSGNIGDPAVSCLGSSTTWSSTPCGINATWGMFSPTVMQLDFN